MDITIKKLQNNIDSSLFRFFSDMNRIKTTPVVNAIADVNLITVLYEVLHGYDKELYSKLADEKYYTQLEAASRIFYIDKEKELKSAFYTSDNLGSILDSNTLLQIEKEVIKLIKDYKPHESSGISISSTVDNRPYFPITFMKYTPKTYLSASSLEKLRDHYREEIIPSKEYEILSYIVNEKLSSITRSKQNRLKTQVLASKEFSLIDNKEELFKYAWNNSFLEYFNETGAYAGMKKIYHSCGELPHNALNAFIELYNKASN